MEETEIKSLPWSGAYKRMGEISVPFMGIISLLIVVLRFLRTTDDLARLGLGTVALGVVMTAFAYFKLARNIGRLREKIDEKNLATLCLSTYNLTLYAYLICVMALTVAATHH